jgi:hypothetical protein
MPHFPIIEGIESEPFSAVDDLLKAGVSAYYTDPRFSETEYVVREDPNGAKTLMRFNGEGWDDVKPL